jgi:HD-GYP domain-containing protein (c-di-GMP phosphodiesterase class II)
MRSLESLEILVSDLEIGMYVSALDKPWSQTPFLLQGFYITSQEDIEELERHCHHVYIDVYQSRTNTAPRTSRAVGSHSSRPIITGRPDQEVADAVKFKARTGNTGALLFPHRKLKKYEDASGGFQREMSIARSVHSELSGAVDSMFEEYQRSNVLNVSGIRSAVDPMVDSVIRNPDACVWLARMKSEDSYTFRHSVGASIWAVALGRQLGLPKVDLQRLALGALLFDVGKLRIPAELLQKRERLSRGEYELLKSHVGFGLEMLGNTGVLNRSVTEMVEFHHERHGGHGYPHGLKGDEIPVMARIAGIVDCYDAITSRRPYAEPMSPSQAVKKLYAWRDIDFQAELVEEFIQAIGIYPAGTLVELSNGEVGVVLAEYRTRRLRPQLLVMLDRNKVPLRDPRPLDLRSVTHDDDGKPLEIVTSLEPGAFGVDIESLTF